MTKPGQAMTLLISYLLLALGVSSLCSLVEAGILSLSRAHVARLVKANRPSGRILDAMKRNIDRPLSAILTLNTIAHTIGAAGVGAEAFDLFGQEWVAATSAVLTLLILVLSEIIPKTVGAVYAPQLAAFTAYTVRGMIVLTYPLVVVFQGLSRALAGSCGPHRVTREELTLIAELGQAEGALDEKEYRVIRNILRLNTIHVGEVMTPRNVVSMLQADLTCQQAAEQAEALRFSRTPVFGDSPDDVVGVVFRHEVHEAVREGRGARTLKQIAHPIHAVPETASVAHVMDEFVERREHLFHVVDEYGGTAGIVTLEDSIETLLGEEIMDETDAVADMRQLAVRLYRGAR
ncbi:MAG: hemolysin family protein [Phycisphaerae bacterium]